MSRVSSRSTTDAHQNVAHGLYHWPDINCGNSETKLNPHSPPLCRKFLSNSIMHFLHLYVMSIALVASASALVVAPTLKPAEKPGDDEAKTLAATETSKLADNEATGVPFGCKKPKKGAYRLRPLGTCIADFLFEGPLSPPLVCSAHMLHS
ncbi:hypothetical protein H4582DRAFT_410752 [Lactarius indigo]|nr:hypothetical protein H4582DRAFT_410752 [Lactarius indigo]